MLQSSGASGVCLAPFVIRGESRAGEKGSQSTGIGAVTTRLLSRKRYKAIPVTNARKKREKEVKLV